MLNSPVVCPTTTERVSAEMAKFTKATGLNNRSIILLTGGSHVEAMKFQQEATGLAMELLEGLNKKTTDAINGGAKIQLAVVPLAKAHDTVTKPKDGSCLVLHKVFKIPPENESEELAILVILYNLAYMFHSRGILEKTADKSDLKKAKDLYGLVKNLVIDRGLLTMDNPLFQLALLNNLSQVNHALGERKVVKELFLQIADIMKDKLSQVSEEDQNVIQLNLRIREEPEEKPAKKPRQP
jgi:hypothetical protein